ncbi:MAG TPA: twin-arginine translocase subunit TatC [Candidatus Limnocylindrales bacterium]|jgi:sec-independent protein translocase protein TatC
MADADARPGPGLTPSTTAVSPPVVTQPVPSAPTPTPPAATPAVDETVMSLVDHLEELRSRLVRTIIAVLVGSIVGFAFGDQIISFLKSPIPGDAPLFFTGLGDPFVIRMKIGLVVGIILAMPVILYQVWAFVAPGLTPRERETVRPWIPMALGFFALGVAIAYLVLPFAAQFLLSFTTTDLQPLITAGAYFDFVTTMFLAFGLVMEFPILLFGLSRVGILTSERLRAARRYVILGIAIFSAVATPGGDLVSPFVLGGTMYLLYEATTLLIRRSGR